MTGHRQLAAIMPARLSHSDGPARRSFSEGGFTEM